MSGTYEFDDEAIEAFLRGAGCEINEDLAAAVAAVRSTFVSQSPAVGAELAAVIGDVWPEAAAIRRTGPMRLTVALRRLAVATGVLFGLTGSLAVANALPTAIQNAVASVGIGEPRHDDSTVNVSEDEPGAETTTTTESNVTTTTTGDDGGLTTSPPSDNHGKEVAAVARDKALTGCEHGRAVATVAAGKTNDKTCPHSSTTTTTTFATAVSGEDAPANEPGTSKGYGHDGTTSNGDNNNRPTGKGKQSSDDGDD